MWTWWSGQLFRSYVFLWNETTRYGSDSSLSSKANSQWPRSLNSEIYLGESCTCSFHCTARRPVVLPWRNGKIAGNTRTNRVSSRIFARSFFFAQIPFFLLVFFSLYNIAKAVWTDFLAFRKNITLITALF